MTGLLRFYILCSVLFVLKASHLQQLTTTSTRVFKKVLLTAVLQPLPRPDLLGRGLALGPNLSTHPALLPPWPEHSPGSFLCSRQTRKNSTSNPKEVVCLRVNKVQPTTLAHIIASSSKKKGSARFVTLSATSTSTNEVREVIKQAQNELRLCKRKTILFIDEIHRFNKSQQDTFLPHVECGTVTLIGATTENPSFQVNAALLSRCRVLVLEKLSVEAMGSILNRAVETLGIRVRGALNSQHEDLASNIFIEQKALDTVAFLCDGDARIGLNSLQLAVQAQIKSTDPNRSPREILVTEEHVKEGLQRSHILYDKAGEEHYNCISALHKSMRGSHENASLYWLGRMLEGGEDPLYVARRLVRFASEDVGLADPCALPQAISTFQACHFIGMPECEVILAQCVVYLARAPKSVEIYKAYANVKACVRNHKGPLPPVPLHLRNAPTKLMKQLGYAKGYKYNPEFSRPVEQEYLPEELRGTDFFTWSPSNP
nr:ATPase WRNIP1 isoform X2 [Nothobranchius furzeri]